MVFDAFRKKPKERIVIVSGLPRSGTSMMMRMLAHAGIEPLTDEQRAADADNPRGYFEFEQVKELRNGDTRWLRQARGKAVKVIAFLVEYLPPEFDYDILFMRRAMPEVLASQREMLVRRGEEPDAVSDAEMTRLFEQHMASVVAWAKRQKNIRALEIDYNHMMRDARPQLQALAKFLEGRVDVERMLDAVDPKLYRQRGKS
ncbi:MAG: sulfotransferase family protein [Chloroflexi bacterium]|nr:sulfotransferase family protein [Chloroflexota bacterium]